MFRGIFGALTDAIKLVPLAGITLIYLFLDPVEDKDIRDKILDKV